MTSYAAVNSMQRNSFTVQFSVVLYQGSFNCLHGEKKRSSWRGYCIRWIVKHHSCLTRSPGLKEIGVNRRKGAWTPLAECCMRSTTNDNVYSRHISPSHRRVLFPIFLTRQT